MDFIAKVESCVSADKLPLPLGQCLRKFFFSYKESLEQNGYDIKDYQPILLEFLGFIIEQLESPFIFEPYHQKITQPFDYYRFGLDFIRPLVVFSSSKAHNLESVDRMVKQISQGDNVILLANHQTEPDPQAIGLMLEKTHPRFANDMIFVAGHRVISDPLAVPFSKGCNLLCIFSKKHIETPPDQKPEKLLHNQKTMKRMSQLLAEGGKCIYVAPSGGRDRPDKEGNVDVAPFDPQSIEMFWLMSQQSGRPTHFYPLALRTYNLLPPPSSVEKDLGEKRYAQCTPVHLAFGDEIDMDNFPGSALADKKLKRKLRAEYIWNLVRADYHRLVKSQPLKNRASFQDFKN